MAATLITRFPEKALELFAYQAQIVQAERNYEPGRRVVHDRQFQREALARKDLNWSVTDTRLYSEAFTDRVRAIPRCQFCLQDNHSTPYCPRNPDHPWQEWSPSQPPGHHRHARGRLLNYAGGSMRGGKEVSLPLHPCLQRLWGTPPSNNVSLSYTDWSSQITNSSSPADSTEVARTPPTLGYGTPNERLRDRDMLCVSVENICSCNVKN